MSGTPIKYYLSDEEAENLKKNCSIKSMEQLVALCDRPQSIKSIAEMIGVSVAHLISRVEVARDELKIPKRSNRKYPLGAQNPKCNNGSLTVH